MAKPRAKPKAAKPKKAKRAVVRNAELEARLVANPNDQATREVYADWLQSVGDPLGELLALVNAGKQAHAERLVKRRSVELGGFNRSVLVWRRGFVDQVRITADKANAKKMLDEIFDRPASLFVRELTLGLAPDRGVVDIIANRMRIRKLFCWPGKAIGDLASPTLEYAELFAYRDAPLPKASLAPLLSGKNLPALRRLDLLKGTSDKPLPVEFVEALVKSKLLRQLGYLAFRQSVLDAKGIAVLIEHGGALKHLRGFFIDPSTTDARAAFGEGIDSSEALAAWPTTWVS